MQVAVGKVLSVVGMAMVIDDRGNRHLLKQGDELHAGERLVTAPGALVQMQTIQGETIRFAEQQTIKISEQLADSHAVDATESAVNRAVFEQILQALNSGQDISEFLDDPAAGGVLGEGNASFVNLDRISTAAGALNVLDGGRAQLSIASDDGLENYMYFSLASNSITINPPPPPPPPPPTVIRDTVKTIVLDSDVWGQIGGVMEETDNSISLVNDNVLAGILTDSISLTDNSTSLLNANAVTGIISGSTTVADNSLSVVNAGIVTGVLSGPTTVTDHSTSVVNTDLVTGLLSGNTASTDNSDSLVNTGVMAGVLSGDTALADNSSSLVNTNAVAAILSGDTTVTDRSQSLVDSSVITNVLSGNTTVIDESTSLVNANLFPVLGAGDTQVTNSTISPLIDANIVPVILSGQTTVADNSSSLVNINVVGSLLSGPVALHNDSNSFIDIGLTTELLSAESTQDGLAGLLDNTVLNVDIGKIVNLEVSLDPNHPVLTLETAVDEILSGDTRPLTEALSSISDALNATVAGVTAQGNPTANLLNETILNNAAVPDVIGYLSEPDTVAKDVVGIVDDVLALNVKDILDIDHMTTTTPQGGLLNQTAVLTNAVALITEPLVLNNLLIQPNLLND